MAELRNPRRERFCQAIVRGRKPETAYEEAGYLPHRQNAHRLMTCDDVQDRISELRAPIIAEVQWDYSVRLRMLRDVAVAAMEAGDHRAVIAAIAESNRVECSYRTKPKVDDEPPELVAFRQMIRDVVASSPALPIWHGESESDLKSRRSEKDAA